jgi:hypothetical protein
MEQPRTQTKLAKTILFAFGEILIPILLKLIDILETRHPFVTFRLVTFILVFLLLADIAFLLRGKWRDFLIMLTSLAFGICLIEAVANIWEPPERIVVSPEGLFAPRPVIGWGPGHAGQFHADKTDPRTGGTIYTVNYTIDSNLLRQTQSCETGPAVVFFGCSVTFGIGLNDDQTLPQAFADSLDRKVRVLNLGFGGYGPQHFLSELQFGIFDTLIGPQPRLFVFLTSAGHAERSACRPNWVRRGPRYIIENGQLLLKGACNEGFSLWFRDWLENSAAFNWLIEPYLRRVSRDDIELYIKITLAAVNLAKAKYGVPVIVLYFKSVEDSYLSGTGFSTEDVLQRLRDGGAVVIDAALNDEAAAGMTLKIPGDEHPTALANRLRAAILKNYLEQNMSGVLASSLAKRWPLHFE